MDLKDKTIVITGAAQGLRRKMAEVLARQIVQPTVNLFKPEAAQWRAGSLYLPFRAMHRRQRGSRGWCST